MKVLHNFSKEVIDTIKQLGIIVNELDEHGNIENYYNLPQWFKDVNGHIFECPFDELPNQAKQIHTTFSSGIKGWYEGQNIKSSIKYSTDNKDLKDKIEFIKFMGHTSAMKGDTVKMSLIIRFKDGTDKWILCEPNEDGSFPSDIFQIALNKADEYLGTLQNESLVV